MNLFEKLRALRTKWARKQALPPFMIFSDKTLKDMCVKNPVTEADFLNVSGVGKVKLEQYGESFLNEIKEYQAEA
jgi:Superfamily II DNA helicase